MSTSVGSGVARYAVATRPLLYMIRIMMISIMYMFVALRSHVHMSDITNIIFIIFWIKLLLNLPKIPTIQKPDRHFSVVGFASMLKPNVFRAYITRGGVKDAYYG
jgi:hypothetical protein